MGFDFNRFVDLSKREAKHLICSICLNIYDNAITTECGHTFCRQCLHKWIEDNHSVCPECRKEFSRKRSNELAVNDISVFILNHVFSRNLKINAIINELYLKCDFDFNGCQEFIELGLFQTHLKNCEHRFCKKCRFAAGLPENGHNCIELLKNDRNEWRQKFIDIKDQKSKLEEELQRNRSDLKRWKSMYEKSEQINKELSEKVSKLNEVIERNENEFKLKFEKLEENESKLRQDFDSRNGLIFGLSECLENKELISEFVLFGTYPIHYCTVVLRPNRIYFKSPTHSQFFLPIAYIEELMLCLDRTLPVIIIKTNAISSRAIRNNLQLSDTGISWFDVDSRGVSHHLYLTCNRFSNIFFLFLDPSHRYIIIRFSLHSRYPRLDSEWTDFCMANLYLFRCKAKVFEYIDDKKTRHMIDSALKRVKNA